MGGTVPATLPDRYRLEVRLGHDGDIEDWLATDSALERPVLIRQLAPDATSGRRAQFLEAVRLASAVAHTHLADVYAAGNGPEGAFAVVEWAGGISLGDRVRAGETMPLEEFLPNAAGLADALAAVHAAGFVHGAVGSDAITYSAAHPAKLGRYGSLPGEGGPAADVAGLAGALGDAITGLPGTRLAPSQVAEGVPTEVDAALAAARAGTLDAAGLAAALRHAPTPPTGPPPRAWSWRWLVPAGLLLALLVVVGAIARLADAGDEDPFGLPTTTTTTLAVETSPTTSPPPAPASTTTTLPPPVPVEILDVAVYDPFGDDAEFDRLLPALVDDDPDTAWRTERYFAELGLIKPGVGVTFRIAGTPQAVAVDAGAGTGMQLLWASALPADFDGWEPIAELTDGNDRSVALPARRGGLWLVWFTELSPQPDLEAGRTYFYSFVQDVRFSP